MKLFLPSAALFALLLNAPAMLRSAEKLELDSDVRKVSVRIMTPVARFASALRLDFLRSAAESFEKSFFE